MENLNLPPFYVGQSVIRICDNTKHTILAIERISCGCFVVSVGLSYKTNGMSYYNTCLQCKTSVNKFYHNNFTWHMSIAFKPIQELPFPSLTMKKVIEKERELVSMN